MDSSEASPGITTQRILLPRILSWLALPLSLALTCVGPHFVEAGIYGAMGSVGLLFLLYFGVTPAPALRRAPEGSVAFSETHVIVRRQGHHEQRLARDGLTDGWIESYGGEHKVVLRKRGGDLVWIRAADRDAARRILAGAGFGAAQHLLHCRLVSRLAERFSAAQRDSVILATSVAGAVASVVLYVVAAAGPLGLAAAAVILLAILHPILKWVTPRTAIVGTDGVTVRGLGTKRFIPFAEIERTSADERGVTLATREGPSVLLATAPNPGRANVDPSPSPASKALYDRMREAMAEGQKSTDADARYAVLDRNGRSVEQWREDLRALGSRQAGAAGYRSSWLERHELAEVLGDAGAPGERRIGAALALSAADEPSLERKLRVTVETCANERLRIAIDSAARGELDDAELEEALQLEASAAAK